MADLIARPIPIARPEPLTGERAKAAGADWKLSDEARADIEAIRENVRAAHAMAPFIRVGALRARERG